MHSEIEYLALCDKILMEGDLFNDRTGVGTLGIFGAQMRFDLRDSFPLLTTKRVFWRGVVEELLWMLRGETSVKPLVDRGIHIWDEWANEDGELGPVYGAQWRSWPTGQKGPFVVTRRAPNGEPSAGFQPDIVVDQITNVINSLKTNPNGRRHIVSAWNPALVDDMALPPCHALFQFHVNAAGELSCQLYQRSADMFIGVPFNIASYALLTHIIAHYTGHKVGDFIWTGGDCHIYRNHIEQMKEQLRRPLRAAPTVELNIPDGVAFDQLEFEMFQLNNYNPHPAIKGDVAV